MVVSYQPFGKIYPSHLQKSSCPASCCTAWPMKVDRIGCHERSIRNYYSILFLLDCLTLKYGTDRLFRKVGKTLPFYYYSSWWRRYLNFMKTERSLPLTQQRAIGVSEMNAAHVLTICWFKIDLNVILPSTSGSPIWSFPFRYCSYLAHSFNN